MSALDAYSVTGRICNWETMEKKKRHNKKRHPGISSFIEIEKDHGIYEDYLQYGAQYDTANDCPVIPGEIEVVQKVAYKKLARETKLALRSIMEGLVLDYWNSETQIPYGGILNKMREAAIHEGYSHTGQYAKDDTELKHFLNEVVPVIINKELRKKIANQEDNA